MNPLCSQMPELPEVETIRRELVPRIVGRTITKVQVFWPRVVREPSVEELTRRTTGQTIREIRRRGKYLIFQLSGGDRLILHLKMTGVLLVQRVPQEPRKHSAAMFDLDGGFILHFIDQRKFGAIWLVRDESQVVGKLGPEPLDASFTPALLHDMVDRHRVPIKALLCDQNIIAGVGNMYADEALFAAGIHPLKPSQSLSAGEIERLHRGIIQVLQRGIEQKGASVNSYRRPDGTTGDAHSGFQVAHRRGGSCFVCGSPIARITVRGRGTYFCPNCQKNSHG